MKHYNKHLPQQYYVKCYSQYYRNTDFKIILPVMIKVFRKVSLRENSQKLLNGFGSVRLYKLMLYYITHTHQ